VAERQRVDMGVPTDNPTAQLTRPGRINSVIFDEGF
jgi:hypothetical protein